ncbi:MAG: oligosaccharide flippase family protein [Deltaproteobacteria bacterium]|nr:oligosaccharide flippase family protein [Deltaproteobacteria bacterium]
MSASSEPPEPADEALAGDEPSLEKRAVKGSILEMGFYGAAQVLRLGSNLILTRLLFPEAFGLMTTLAVFNTGLIMLSDVGIEQSVIQNEKGDEKDFLNTAWTVQVLRGWGLYVVALALTYPMAILEKQDALLWLIPIGSLSVPIASLGSTSEFTLRRRVQPGRILMLDFASQVVGVGVMVLWAWIEPSIWALVGGNIVRETFRSIGTHLVLPAGYKNRFRMHEPSRKAIAKFGRWILGSSAVFYLAGFADRLLLLPYLGAERLGIYSIAALLSEAAFTVIGKVIHGVVFPVFSRVGEEGRDQLRTFYYRARLRLDALTMTAVGLLATLGPFFVHLLWDDRYADAGWMLQILALKAGTRTVFVPADYCLMSIGLVRYGFFNNVARAVFIFAGIPIGYSVAGEVGVFWAVALSDLPSVFILWPILAREKLLRLDRELLSWAFAGVGAGVGWLIARGLEMI